MKEAMKEETSKRTNNSAIARIMEHQAEIEDFRWANAKKRRAFWDGAIRLDDGLEDENGDTREDRCLSDRGKGAERIRLCGENMPEPAWLVLMRKAVRKMEKGSRIKRFYECLLSDNRPTVAARNAGISKMQAYRYMRQFKALFAQAHKAWKESR